MDTNFEIIGYVSSPIKTREEAPKQGSEGDVEAIVEVKKEYAAAMEGLEPGGDIILLSWLHESDRTCMRVHPRGDHSRPKRGVFSTRSPDRPNPVGLHPVKLLEIDGTRLKVHPLEVIDGTPIVDIKNADRPQKFCPPEAKQ